MITPRPNNIMKYIYKASSVARKYIRRNNLKPPLDSICRAEIDLNVRNICRWEIYCIDFCVVRIFHHLELAIYLYSLYS